MVNQISGYAAKALGEKLKMFSYAPPPLGENDVRVADDAGKCSLAEGEEEQSPLPDRTGQCIKNH